MRTAQLSLHNVTKRYDERVVLDQVSITVKPGEKVGVIGDNGSGKSTLLRLIAGRERADNGEVTVVAPGGAGYLAQTIGLPLSATVQDAVDLALADLRDLEARMRKTELDEHADVLLSLGLFRPADLRLRIGELSYGQRRRIELARLVSRPVDLMLLDEPTNHLSPSLVEELEEALESYEGALVVVTHDRRMRAGFAGSHLELDGGRLAMEDRRSA